MDIGVREVDVDVPMACPRAAERVPIEMSRSVEACGRWTSVCLWRAHGGQRVPAEQPAEDGRHDTRELPEPQGWPHGWASSVAPIWVPALMRRGCVADVQVSGGLVLLIAEQEFQRHGSGMSYSVTQHRWPSLGAIDTMHEWR